jgi:hypothetical protein
MKSLLKSIAIVVVGTVLGEAVSKKLAPFLK